MEDGLRVWFYDGYSNGQLNVLILVLMEDGLRVRLWQSILTSTEFSLNPCFNGRWSARKGD